MFPWPSFEFQHISSLLKDQNPIQMKRRWNTRVNYFIKWLSRMISAQLKHHQSLLGIYFVNWEYLISKDLTKRHRETFSRFLFSKARRGLLELCFSFPELIGRGSKELTIRAIGAHWKFFFQWKLKSFLKGSHWSHCAIDNDFLLKVTKKVSMSLLVCKCLILWLWSLDKITEMILRFIWH